MGQVVTVRAYVFRVEIAWQDQEIASHSRSYGREEEVLDPHHYLPVLLKKPGAFARATPILRWSLPPVYGVYHRQLQDRREGQGGTREYIRILMLLQDYSLAVVTAAVEQAARAGATPGRGELCPSDRGEYQHLLHNVDAGGAFFTLIGSWVWAAVSAVRS